MSKTALLYSLTPPSSEQEAKFREFLSTKYKEEIELVWKKDSSLKGGFRLHVGSEIYDWSAAGRLSQFKDALSRLKESDGSIVPLIKDTIHNWTPKALAHEEGKVISVGDGIATLEGLENASYGEIIVFESGVRGMVQDLRPDEVGCILFGSDEDVGESSSVRRTAPFTGGRSCPRSGEMVPKC